MYHETSCTEILMKVGYVAFRCGLLRELVNEKTNAGLVLYKSCKGPSQHENPQVTLLISEMSKMGLISEHLPELGSLWWIEFLHHGCHRKSKS